MLPGRVELMIFLTVAVLATGLVAVAPKHDLGIAVLAMPVFIAAAVMGLRKNWAMMDAAEAAAKSVTEQAVGTGEQAAA
jgi:hypothetical protein